MQGRICLIKDKISKKSSGLVLLGVRHYDGSVLGAEISMDPSPGTASGAGGGVRRLGRGFRLASVHAAHPLKL